MFFELRVHLCFFPLFSFVSRERKKNKGGKKKRKTNRRKTELNSLVTIYGTVYGDIVCSFFKNWWFRFVCLIRKSDDEHQHEKTLTTKIPSRLYNSNLAPRCHVPGTRVTFQFEIPLLSNCPKNFFLTTQIFFHYYYF